MLPRFLFPGWYTFHRRFWYLFILPSTLAASNAKLRFPTQDEAPEHRIRKPETGRYHVVRLIRSDLKINIFGERFPVPPEAYLEYVVATIDVEEEKLKLFLDRKEIAIFDYRMR